MTEYVLSKQGQRCLYIAIKSFDTIYKVASGNFELVTGKQSREMGIYSRELIKWAKSS